LPLLPSEVPQPSGPRTRLGLTRRTWPASWQRALIPAGFALAAVSVAAVGLAMRDGNGAGF
jgi:hypothetical protein